MAYLRKIVNYSEKYLEERKEFNDWLPNHVEEGKAMIAK